MDLEKSYRLADDAPPAMSWHEYEHITTVAWHELLAEHPCPRECRFQQFLERHPCLLPGARGVFGTSGHSPHPAAIVSQPKLPDFNYKMPDFMWIARDSLSIYPVLIEIERPDKRWFTAGGQQHSELTTALDQLAEWRVWFESPTNQAKFYEYYRLDVPREHIEPRYVLVHGRRAEANRSSHLQRKRHTLQGNSQLLMTFDRLAPERGAFDFVTVALDADGYRAKFVPPTFQLGPMFARDRAMIRDLAGAVDRSPYLSEERKAFLVKRLPYWSDWVERTKCGVRFSSTGDFE